MSDPIRAASLGAGAARLQGQDGPKTYSLDLGNGGASGPGSFGETITGFVNSVSDAQDAAGKMRERYLNGEQVELHQVMAASEEAGISFDLMVELRNKVLEAYRTLINMQS